MTALDGWVHDRFGTGWMLQTDALSAILFVVVALFVSRKPSIGAASLQLFGGRVSRRLLNAAQINPAASPSALALPAWLRLFGRFATLPAEIRNSVAGAERRLRRRQQGLQKIHRTRVPRDALSVRSVALRLPSRWLHPERSLTQNRAMYPVRVQDLFC